LPSCEGGSEVGFFGCLGKGFTLNQSLDVVASDFVRVYEGLVILDDLTLLVDEELGPAKLNLLSQSVGSVVQLTVASQKSEDGMCVLPVDLHLREQREFDVVACSKSFDVFFRARLLIIEGVARKAKDLEALVTELFVQADQICI